MQSSCYAALQLNPEWASTVSHTSASPFPLSSKHHLEPLCYQCLLPCPSSPSASLITSSNWLQLLSRAEWNHACTPPWWLCLPQLTENTWRTYKFEVLKKGAFFCCSESFQTKSFCKFFPAATGSERAQCPGTLHWPQQCFGVKQHGYTQSHRAPRAKQCLFSEQDTSSLLLVAAGWDNFVWWVCVCSSELLQKNCWKGKTQTSFAAFNQKLLPSHPQHKPRCRQGQALLGEKGLFTGEATTFYWQNSANTANLGHRDGKTRLYIN